MTSTAVRAMTREDLEREIQDRNARFDALSPAERRVAIMLDVKQQIRQERIRVREGYGYIAIHNDIPTESQSQSEMQEVVDGIGPESRCTVCALGATFVSAAQLFDRLPRRSSLYTLAGDHLSYLRQFFPMRQCRLIEAAFEGVLIDGRYSGEDVIAATTSFYYRYPNDAERLEAIADNIITNGGDFRP